MSCCDPGSKHLARTFWRSDPQPLAENSSKVGGPGAVPEQQTLAVFELVEAGLIPRLRFGRPVYRS
jgi:hypothetical protein